jgi:hypothetical protein
VQVLRILRVAERKFQAGGGYFLERHLHRGYERWTLSALRGASYDYEG